MSLNKNNGIETLDNLDNPSTSIEAESIDVDSLEKKFEEYENLFGNLHDLEKQGKGKNDQEDSHGSSLNHKLSKFDETLDKSNEMQDVHDFSSPAKTQSEVFEKLTDYYNSHNYGKMDYAEYSIDPKWQELNNAYRQENGLEPIEYSDKTNDSQSGAFERLSEYYNSNNYSKMDYPEYSKDPEWQKLNNAYLKEKGQEPISDSKNIAENVTNVESVDEPGKSTTTEKVSDENQDVAENSDEKLVHNVLENVDTKDTAGSQKELTGDDITEKVPNVAKDTAPENVSGIEKEVNKAIDEGKASDMAEDSSTVEITDIQEDITSSINVEAASNVVEATSTDEATEGSKDMVDSYGVDENDDVSKDVTTDKLTDAKDVIGDDSSVDGVNSVVENAAIEYAVNTQDKIVDVSEAAQSDGSADTTHNSEVKEGNTSGGMGGMEKRSEEAANKTDNVHSKELGDSVDLSSPDEDTEQKSNVPSQHHTPIVQFVDFEEDYANLHDTFTDEELDELLVDGEVDDGDGFGEVNEKVIDYDDPEYIADGLLKPRWGKDAVDDPEIISLPEGTRIIQYAHPGCPGQYFAPEGTKYEDLQLYDIQEKRICAIYEVQKGGLSVKKSEVAIQPWNKSESTPEGTGAWQYKAEETADRLIEMGKLKLVGVAY